MITKRAQQNMANEWICYVVSGIYSTLLIGCLIGIYMNYSKKRELKELGNYSKNSKVIRWKFRFYDTLFFATICRISAIIGATIYDKELLLSKAKDEAEFLWQIAASFGSLFYFTSFSLIIWFFAQIAYYKQDSKQKITILIITVNVILYCSQIMLAISDYITKDWDLVYDVQLPLFSVCNWILSFFFVFFSCKIASSIKSERKETIDYHIEHSYSATGSRQGSNYRQQPQPILKQNNNPMQAGSSSVGVVGAVGSGDNRYIVPRLVKLSILCATMWILRGLYTMSLRIWPSSNYLDPINTKPLIWESIFYLITEYPPSLGALFLMILKPRKNKNSDIIHQYQQQKYPKAKFDHVDQRQSLLFK